MSSWMPAMKRAPPQPVDDAPLSSLPACESKPLTELQQNLDNTVFSAPDVLHPEDPWQTLAQQERAALALRFLRFQALSVPRALAQVQRVAHWRREQQPWKRCVTQLVGSAAGIPLLECTARGSDAELLLYAPTRAYDKTGVDHACQEMAVRALLEHVLYSARGPRARAAVLVMDFSDFSMRQVDLAATRNGIRVFLSYYPEAFAAILLVNFPRWIHGTWRVVAPLLDARSVRKVEFLADGCELRDRLMRFFDEADVPRWLGGRAGDGPLKLFTGETVNAEKVAASLS